jgi:hypothetical protein
VRGCVVVGRRRRGWTFILGVLCYMYLYRRTQMKSLRVVQTLFTSFFLILILGMAVSPSHFIFNSLLVLLFLPLFFFSLLDTILLYLFV